MEEDAGLQGELGAGLDLLRKPELLPPLLDLAQPEQREREVEPDGRRVWEPLRQWAEMRERPLRVGLVEESERSRGLSVRIVRRPFGCPREHALRRERMPEPLERDPVPDPVVDAAAAGELGELGAVAASGE